MQYKIFGCKTNKYFTEKWMPLLEEKDGYFISSCVVTDKAKAKWVKHALQILSRLKDHEKLYLSGCGNIRNGVVDPKFFEIYHELLPFKEKIELLPEDPDDLPPFGRGERGVYDSDALHPPLEGGNGGFTALHPPLEWGNGGFTALHPPLEWGNGGFLPFRPDLTEKARKLRKNMTGPEKNIWFKLLVNSKLEGYKFTRQKPLLDYIVDFYCHDLQLAVEIDGESHTEQKEYDEIRTKELLKLGISVIRFTNKDCFQNIEGVYERLIEYIRVYRAKPPCIPPSKGDKIEQNLLVFPLPRGIRSLKSIGKNQLFTRRYMVIQNGCDNFCTFCLTVQARGRHKWRPMDEIVDEINEFVEGGGREVVFTGTNLGAWGSASSADFGDSRFVELVETILEKTELERLRISSLGVEFCTDKLINLFKNSRIIAYAHLSIQSASSTILKSMNRHYDGEFLRQVLSKFHTIKREDDVILNLGADLIVGFPGETEDDFRQTLDIVRQYEITQLHAFAFSPHVDHYSVPAGSFPEQIPNHIAQRRLKELIHTGEEVSANFLEKNRGKEFRVLIEKVMKTPLLRGDDDSQGSLVSFTGWTENYIKVDNQNFTLLPSQNIRKNEVVRGRLL